MRRSPYTLVILTLVLGAFVTTGCSDKSSHETAAEEQVNVNPPEKPPPKLPPPTILSGEVEEESPVDGEGTQGGDGSQGEPGSGEDQTFPFFAGVAITGLAGAGLYEEVNSGAFLPEAVAGELSDCEKKCTDKEGSVSVFCVGMCEAVNVMLMATCFDLIEVRDYFEKFNNPVSLNNCLITKIQKKQKSGDYKVGCHDYMGEEFSLNSIMLKKDNKPYDAHILYNVHDIKMPEFCQTIEAAKCLVVPEEYVYYKCLSSPELIVPVVVEAENSNKNEIPPVHIPED